ncbi:MAG: haloacid dehalogenase type II [Chloroflexota bacterium]|nr:haloacid dehalogenase type II [Chloroflexota bacterium]MDE2961796.1 haloacid dehalogenase type II [Chloroflexota bacterium]
MTDNPVAQVNTLVFDIFGTVLDLGGSLSEPAGRFLAERGSIVTADRFWDDWRGRQRIEQYQDNLYMLGHSGYLETCRRSFVYCLRLHGVEFDDADVNRFMAVYEDLRPFDDAVQGLRKLVDNRKFGLVVLSNGEQSYLERMAANNVGIPFDDVISVEKAGAFKPHPAVYRTAARILGKAPGEIMMISSHSFDVTGARASGFRAGYVNRYKLPNEVSAYLPDFEVADFHELVDLLISTSKLGTSAS